MEQIKTKIELPQEITDAITKAVFDTFAEAKNSLEDNKFPLYMSKRQACDYVGISNRTMDDWLATGQLPYTHIGKIYRFNRNDLDKFMATK